MIPGRSRILVVAGHDSSGGAGVDADREAIRAQGCGFEAVVTALTVQDEHAFHDLGARPVEEWEAEALVRLAQGPPGAVKIGLLPGVAAVEATGRLLRNLRPGTPVVLDPVLASSTGATFLDPEGRAALLEVLLPYGVILTPNLPEAALLTGCDPAELVREPTRAFFAGATLLERGAGGVVLKGGHGPHPELVLDLVLRKGRPPASVSQPRVPGPGLHGSGCRHASTLAARLARGDDLEQAARVAASYVLSRLRTRPHS